MVRVLLVLVALSAPALAPAQSIQLTPGEVTLANGRTYPLYVNAAECQGGVTVTARWNVALVGTFTTFPPGGAYTVYGSNQAATTASTCATNDNTTTGLKAGIVPDLNNTPAVGFAGSALIDLGTLISKAGKSCANNWDIVYLCVQGTVSGQIFGFAQAQITISTTKPPPPTITGVHPGDGALNMDWAPGNTTSTFSGDTQEYYLQAIATTTGSLAVDPQGTHQTGRLTGTTSQLEGLVNDVVYEVRARAFSKADNLSDPSNAVTGMPQAWIGAPPPGGGGGGGCASALAGPLGFAILAATLALRPRRRNR